MTKRVVLLVGVLAAAMAPAGPASAVTSGTVVERTWVAVAGGPQQNGVMAYDSVHDQTVLLIAGDPSQTWTFSGASHKWTRRFPATNPSLHGAAIAFDAARGNVVAFGSDATGDNCDPGTHGETWTWDGTNWQQLHPASAPDECEGLGGHGIAYDAVQQTVVLIAVDNFGAGNTWLWNGVNWHWVDNAAASALPDSAVAYDPVSRAVLKFGGTYFFHGYNDFNDTQRWTGTHWKEIDPGFSIRYAEPAARSLASMTYDPAVGGLVLFGGEAHTFDGGIHKLSDTWRWVGTHWVRMGLESSPPAMSDAALVTDTQHQIDVLFDGGGKTWLFTAAHAGGGYFLAEQNGAVVGLGDAHNVGDAHTHHLNRPIVGIARTPTRRGYWLTATDGGIFAYGDAHYFGSTGGIHLNQPIVGIAATPSGRGYWLVARDGGVFTFGDARYHGSTGGIRLNQPIVGMAATPTGDGYWLVASDGGVFTFGDAHYYGSAGGLHLTQPVTGMAATPRGDGYWLVARDGGVFNYGKARFAGATPSLRPMIAIASSPTGAGYTLFDNYGDAYNHGDAKYHGGAPGAAVVGAVTT
jgi:hypothetical protein